MKGKDKMADSPPSQRSSTRPPAPAETDTAPEADREEPDSYADRAALERLRATLRRKYH